MSTSSRPPDDTTNTPEDQQLLDDLAFVQESQAREAREVIEKRLRALPHLIRLLGLDHIRAEGTRPVSAKNGEEGE